jgi:hypothetical protein
MKKLLLVSIVLVFLIACTNDKKEKATKEDKRISLRPDTINMVKLTDTLIIFESTCRGCAYENSTNFDISDSLGIIKLEDIITTDSNPSGMDGGSISKDLILVPLKTGTTTFKLYKFWEQVATAKDSARFTPYTIEVRN